MDLIWMTILLAIWTFRKVLNDTTHIQTNHNHCDIFKYGSLFAEIKDGLNIDMSTQSLPQTKYVYSNCKNATNIF